MLYEHLHARVCLAWCVSVNIRKIFKWWCAIYSNKSRISIIYYETYITSIYAEKEISQIYGAFCSCWAERVKYEEGHHQKKIKK